MRGFHSTVFESTDEETPRPSVSLTRTILVVTRSPHSKAFYVVATVLLHVPYLALASQKRAKDTADLFPQSRIHWATLGSVDFLLKCGRIKPGWVSCQAPLT